MAVAGFEILVLLVALRSPLLALLVTLAVGVMLILTLALGTRRGTVVLAVVLLVTQLVLPNEIALQYRLPVGGGGIFIVDVLLFLVVVSWVLRLLNDTDVSFVRSPVTLPLILFLVWTAVSTVIGVASGNDLKYILQDARGLGYYILFLWGISSIRTRDDIVLWLRVLCACMFAGFAIGVYYSLLGRGMTLSYVQGTVSRFPAPNETFVIGLALAVSFAVLWPAGRRRPPILWIALLLALIGVVLAFVRGYWLGLAVGFTYLFLVLRIGGRLRLIGGGIALLMLLGVTLAAVQPEVFDSVVTRASAVNAYGTDPSVQYRLIENRAVLAQIRDHPLRGNGLGTTYLFDFSRYHVAAIYKVYIHNNYLWFAQRMGIVGVGLFAWMMVAFIYSGGRMRASVSGGDPWLVGLVVGSRVMIVSLLMISISSPQFNVKGEVAVVAVVMAMAEVAGSLLRETADGADGAVLAAPSARVGRLAPSGLADDRVRQRHRAEELRFVVATPLAPRKDVEVVRVTEVPVGEREARHAGRVVDRVGGVEVRLGAGAEEASEVAPGLLQSVPDLSRLGLIPACVQSHVVEDVHDTRVVGHVVEHAPAPGRQRRIHVHVRRGGGVAGNAIPGVAW